MDVLLNIINSFGRLDTINARFMEYGSKQSSPARQYVYDAWGRVEMIKDYNLGSGGSSYITKSLSYDDFGRVTGIVYHNEASELLESFNYSYNKASEIVSETHVQNLTDALPQAETKTYSYNSVGKLIESASDVKGVTIYGWDQAGNRRLEQRDSAPAVWSEFNTLNQMTAKSDGTVLSYDAKGNLVKEVSTTDPVNRREKHFSYDVESRLSAVQAGPVNGQANQFVTLNTNTYRGDGQRITKTEPGDSIKYVYQGGAVLYTLDASGNLINNHVNTPDGALISMMYERNGDTVTSSFSTDIRSSISMVLGDSNDYLTGFSYSDFGVTEKLEETQELLEVAYTGGIWDACTGLYYLNARYYNPVDARFLTLDTARNGGDIRATLSLYGYCEGDPINATDPSGLVKQYNIFGQMLNQKQITFIAKYPAISSVIFFCAEDARTEAENSGIKGVRGRSQDAFRHAFWNAWSIKSLTSRTRTIRTIQGKPARFIKLPIGRAREYVKQFTTYHEYGMTGSETEMDLINNARGRQMAADYPSYGMKDLSRLVKSKTVNGKLVIVSLKNNGQPNLKNGRLIKSGWN